MKKFNYAHQVNSNEMPWMEKYIVHAISPVNSFQGVEGEEDGKGSIFLFDSKSRSLYDIIDDDGSASILSKSTSYLGAKSYFGKVQKLACCAISKDNEMSQWEDFSEASEKQHRAKRLAKKTTDIIINDKGRKLSQSETTYKTIGLSDISYDSRIGHRSTLYEIGRNLQLDERLYEL